MITKQEIERELKFAKDPEKQFEIIAELNAMSLDQVKRILNSPNGLDAFATTRKRGAPRKWTDAEIDRIVELYNEGYTLKAIGVKFGYLTDTPVRNVLRNYVYGKRDDFIPRKQGWEKEELEEAVNLKRQGLKTRAIAQRLGKTPECVRAMLKKHMGDYDESTNPRSCG